LNLITTSTGYVVINGYYCTLFSKVQSFHFRGVESFVSLCHTHARRK